MNIAVVGTGYVGLVTGVCLADRGHRITCVDIRETVVKNLNKGIPHIHENGLEKLLAGVLEKGNFRATTDLAKTVEENDVVIVAVGTPSTNGKIDLTQILDLSKSLGQIIKASKKYISVIVKSTVVPGTTDTFVRQALEEHSGKKVGEFGLGMNPEFLREGEAIGDFMNPDRIVLGFEDETTRKRLEEIYASWSCDKMFVNTRTAEMIKYANNTVLACLISLNNELANLASNVGKIDYLDVVKGVSLDKRWSPIQSNGTRVTPGIIEYMKPGVGYGGSCFPKDVEAIRSQGMNHGLPMTMTNAVIDVNNSQVKTVLSLVDKRINGLRGKKIVILGLAFKPNTDDIRESSALKIVKELAGQGGAHIVAHDPIAMDFVKPLNLNIQFTDDWRSEVKKADVIIIGTNWTEYKEVLAFYNAGLLPDKIIFDSKRLFKKGDFKEVNYITIG